MIAIVCGGRKLTDKQVVFKCLDKAHAEMRFTKIVEGGQRTRDNSRNIIGGADYFAKLWAESRGVECVTEEADWGRYGRSAGPRRNAKMLADYNPDIVVSFKGGRGTADMVARAKFAGVAVLMHDGQECVAS